MQERRLENSMHEARAVSRFSPLQNSMKDACARTCGYDALGGGGGGSSATATASIVTTT